MQSQSQIVFYSENKPRTEHLLCAITPMTLWLLVSRQIKNLTLTPDKRRRGYPSKRVYYSRFETRDWGWRIDGASNRHQLTALTSASTNSISIAWKALYRRQKWTSRRRRWPIQGKRSMSHWAAAATAARWSPQNSFGQSGGILSAVQQAIKAGQFVAGQTSFISGHPFLLQRWVHLQSKCVLATTHTHTSQHKLLLINYGNNARGDHCEKCCPK